MEEELFTHSFFPNSTVILSFVDLRWAQLYVSLVLAMFLFWILPSAIAHHKGLPWLSLDLWYNTKRTHLVRQVPTTNYKHKHDLMWLLLMEQDKILKWFLKAHNGGVWDMLETWRILPYRLYIYNIHICMYVYIQCILYNVYTIYIIQNFHNSLLYYVMRKQQRISPGSSQWNRCRQFSQLWWGNLYFIITVSWSKLYKIVKL